MSSLREDSEMSPSTSMQWGVMAPPITTVFRPVGKQGGHRAVDNGGLTRYCLRLLFEIQLLYRFERGIWFAAGNKKIESRALKELEAKTKRIRVKDKKNKSQRPNNELVIIPM